MSKTLTKLGWQGMFLTQTGSSHEVRGLACQDAAALLRVAGTLYLAVADGAGSRPLGGVGAEVAVAGILRFLKKEAPSPIDPNWPDHFRRGVVLVRATLAQKARGLGVPLDELATTLLFAVVTPQNAIAAHIGDGACVVRGADSSYHTLSAAERAGFANETCFVTDRDFQDVLRLAVYRRPITGVAAFSDGLEAGALSSAKGPHAGFFDPLFCWCALEDPAERHERFAEFLRSDHLRKHTDDDCSLVIATFLER